MSSVEKKVYLGLVVCLLVSIIGVSFAYFTSGVSTNGKGGSVSGKTADLIKVQYDAGSSALTLSDAVPGASASKDFSVKITPTSDEDSATYAINLKIDSNTFVKCSDASACEMDAEELVYTLKENGVEVLNATGDLLERIGTIEIAKITKTVDTEATFNYTLEVTYKNLNSNQNHNENKSLVGSIDVVFAE